MATFNRIRNEYPIYESDNSTAQRTGKYYTKWVDHKDSCTNCMVGEPKCWKGRELWESAQEAAKPRILGYEKAS